MFVATIKRTLEIELKHGKNCKNVQFPNFDKIPLAASSIFNIHISCHFLGPLLFFEILLLKAVR